MKPSHHPARHYQEQLEIQCLDDAGAENCASSTREETPRWAPEHGGLCAQSKTPGYREPEVQTKNGSCPLFLIHSLVTLGQSALPASWVFILWGVATLYATGVKYSSSTPSQSQRSTDRGASLTILHSSFDLNPLNQPQPWISTTKLERSWPRSLPTT